MTTTGGNGRGADAAREGQVPREKLLEVSGLTVEYASKRGRVRAIEGVSLSLDPGERLGIVGESGSGKTTLGLALAGLLPKAGRIVSGSVRYRGEELTTLRGRQLRRIRGQEIAVVFQDAKTALDPVRKVGTQIAEAARAHRPISRKEGFDIAAHLVAEVELPNPHQRLAQYPHELSGGMRQRAMIAMALAGEPKILVADEPTSALDVTTQANVMSLLARLGRERNMSTILITHDLGVVAGFADSVLVLYAAAAMESGPVDSVFEGAAHPYTRALIGAVPSLTGPRQRRLRFIPGSIGAAASSHSGCRFEPRCAVGRGRERCRAEEPAFVPNGLGTVTACFFPGEAPKERADGDIETAEIATGAAALGGAVGVLTATAPGSAEARATSGSDDGRAASTGADRRATAAEGDAGVVESGPVVVADSVSRNFVVRHQGDQARAVLRALDGVSFEVGRGEAFGIVGESGSGKTTLARIMVGLLSPSSGKVELRAGGSEGRKSRRDGRPDPGTVQMIFQDPGDSLDPLLTVDKIIAEPLEVTRRGWWRRRYRSEVAEALAAVGLGPEMVARRAGELSGGQKQRVAIARSLTTHPVLLVADEAVASLDMSARGQVLNLLADIQERSGLTCVHISHDLSMVRHICDRVAVMHAGRIVELAGAEALFAHPRHPYTAGLISAIPSPDPAFERTRQRIAVVGEHPDLTKRWSGCPYRSRCPRAQELCAEVDPPLAEHSPGHFFACHFPEEIDDLVGVHADPEGALTASATEVGAAGG